MNDHPAILGIVCFAAGVLVTLALVGCPRDGPNSELARTAREAVELAHDAQADDRSAVLWAGRFRVLAVVLGIGIPLVVAAYIWRSSAKGEIDPAEVIERVEQYALDRARPPQEPMLPTRNLPEAHEPADPPDPPEHPVS
jgi:hypothetical protein